MEEMNKEQEQLEEIQEAPAEELTEEIPAVESAAEEVPAETAAEEPAAEEIPAEPAKKATPGKIIRPSSNIVSSKCSCFGSRIPKYPSSKSS